MKIAAYVFKWRMIVKSNARLLRFSSSFISDDKYSGIDVIDLEVSDLAEMAFSRQVLQATTPHEP